MPADCEINDCAVLAVGRCHDCNRAFCATHQAYNSVDGVRYRDWCTACQNHGAKQAAQRAQAARQSFLEAVRACEARPFPRLLAGAVLQETSHPKQKLPWSLYDPTLQDTFTPSIESNEELFTRITRDFVKEARQRRLEPERRVRSERSVMKGVLLKRKRWEKVYDNGWFIPFGSNLWRGGKSDSRFNAIVWPDGAVTTDFENRESRLHDGALVTMAGLLEINTTPQN